MGSGRAKRGRAIQRLVAVKVGGSMLSGKIRVSRLDIAYLGASDGHFRGDLSTTRARIESLVDLDPRIFSATSSSGRRISGSNREESEIK
jgi:hypothetical protein